MYGNRGGLDDHTGIIRRRFDAMRWVACRLEFRGWHRTPLIQPGRFTELFFLDEATAFAAGHGRVRSAGVRTIGGSWRSGGDPAGPGRCRRHRPQLHAERVGPEREDSGITRRLEDLPDGAFVLHEARRIS